MYNPQLETFLRVADAGSFNKAAEESFITPTAVIKQINLLENSLDVKLFERTHRGLTLTKAGKSLYQDAKYIIQYCRDSVTRAKNAMQEDTNIIRIGSSPMTPAQLLMQIWPKVQAHCPDIKFQIIPFENTPENAREILANLGKNIDIVGGIFDEAMLSLRNCAGLQLSEEPLCCAVSIHHRLAAKDKLQIEDLYGENLLMMRRGWSHSIDRLRDSLQQNHDPICIVDFEFYSMSIFNCCENGNDVLLAIPGWANVHLMIAGIAVVVAVIAVAIGMKLLAGKGTDDSPEAKVSRNGKVLVVYYSATGYTERVATYIAEATGGELFELKPVEEYSSADLDWTDRNSRVSREHENPVERMMDLVASTVPDWESYDEVFIGYPIWWGIAAWPVDRFIADNDFTGKMVIPFCTSSSSGLGESGELLTKAAGTGEWLTGKRFRSGASEETVQEWVESLLLE